MKIRQTVAGAARGVVLLGVALGGVAQVCGAVFMADGIKTGDVTQTSAIVWTRLTQQPELKRDGFAFIEKLRRKNEPTETEQLQGHALAEMEGAMPGAAGEVRFLCWADGEQSAQAKSTAWIRVSAAKDFTARAPLSGLRAATRYRVRAEGREMREFIATQKNLLVITGDRHWQYVSVDAATGLREYGCGPTSDAHAGGFSEADRTPMHRYLKIVGGFLAVTIERVDGKVRAVLRHYGTNGEINHEDVVVAP